MSNSPGGATYRFLECTASQYMTPAVKTVTRQVTLRDLETLFEKHDFNAFPVVEAGKMLGIVTKFDFLQAFAFTTSQIVPHFDELMRRTPRCGRSRTNRAATTSASDGFHFLPETRSSIDTNVLSATALGIAAKRVASSHGSTFIRASAERTLSRIPLASSQIDANRKSSYREVGLEAEGRLSMTEPPSGVCAENLIRID